MRLELSAASRITIELRATGLLKVVGHDPTLVAHPEPVSFELGEGEIDVPVEVRFSAARIEMPADLGASDREKMRENMLGRDVLDASRHPRVELRGRYRGTIESGRLEGDLVLRGSPRRIGMDVRVARDDTTLIVTGIWEGRLVDLGIKPFKALMGALRLEDWIRIRLDARLAGG